MRQWETLARKEIPAARAQDRPTLLNSLPEFLDEMAATLTDKDIKVQGPKHHAEDRSGLPEYSLEAVIKEYHLLRRAIFDVLEEDAPLDREAREVIENRLDLGIQEAASRYARLAQEALREEDEVRHRLEARQTAMFHSALDAIILMNHHGKVVEWNPAAEDLFGYAQEDALGKNLADLIIPPDFRERHRRGLAQYRDTGVGPIVRQRLVLPAVRADGRDLLVELTVIPIPTDGPLVFMGCLRDVTESTRREADLRSVLSSADCLLWYGEVRENEYGWFHWTTEFIDEEGVKRRIPLEVGEGETYRGAWHQSRLPQDRERADNEANEALRNGRDGYQQEFRHRLADGRIVWFLQRVNIEKLAERHWRLVGVCLDITERKRVEEERDSILLHARCILWSADVSCWEDANGRHLDWKTLHFDEAAAQGVLPLDPLPGETYATAIWRSRNPKDNERMGEVSRRAFFSRENSYRQEFRCTDRHGREHWLHEDVSIQPLEEGRWRAVGVITEITERKRLELALEERAEALAEADRRKDQFLTMLAHELRNPLSPMLNAVHILQKGGPQEPALVRARGIIERQVRHQARLIDDLLDAARIQNGRVELSPERLDLARLVREATDLYCGIYEERGLSLELVIDAEPLYVRADPTRMAQVLGNLLDNAGKYTPSGGRVTVRLTTREGEAQVAVEDTGIGIDASLLPCVFETFTQADRSLDRSQGGLGLGLSLVKGLVDAHGGRIIVESEGLERGARFTISLPLEVQDPVDERTALPSDLPLRRLRILIIEDNLDAAQILGDLLAFWGHEVLTAFDGPEGVERFGGSAPEVVVCDIGLPGMDGFEVARLIRQMDGREAYLLALTGYGGEEVRRRAEEAGFNGFLTKPASPDALMELLAKVPLLKSG